MRGLAALILGFAGLGVIWWLRDSSAQASVALPALVQDGLTLGLSVLVESIPFIVLGIALSVLVQVWVPQHWLMRILPRHPLPRRFVISILGMFLPVCECGNVPLARGLISRSYSVSDSMTFLLAAPIVNPVTIITTHQAFGFDDGILVARLVGALLIANLLGWLFSRHPSPEELLTDRFAASCRVEHDGLGEGRVARSLEMFVRESSALMPALIIGSVVAGAIQMVVSRDLLVALGNDPLLSVLSMMVLAFVISICANVDSFFILPFAETFLPGSLVAFLLLGPIVDVKMLALMRTTFRGSTLLWMTVLVASMTAAIGMAVNLVA